MHIATCCGACIAMSHAKLAPNSFLVPAQHCNVYCETEQIDIEYTAARINKKFWKLDKNPHMLDLPEYAGQQMDGMSMSFGGKLSKRSKLPSIKELGD